MKLLGGQPSTDVEKDVQKVKTTGRLTLYFYDIMQSVQSGKKKPKCFF